MAQQCTGDPVGRRVREFEVTPGPDGRYRFAASLVDTLRGGRFETPEHSVVIHNLTATGALSADDLVLLEIDINFERHPFPVCPLVIPKVQELVGLPITGSWRREVLSRLRKEHGCTHVTTLLLGLTELATLVYTQRMNERTVYGPTALASGEWIASGIEVVPQVVGACHALVPDGVVMEVAKRARERRARG